MSTGPARAEIRPLTGLRGIAALWVVACHWSGAEITGPARDIALHGYVAVDLFMVLSGFVLALTTDAAWPSPAAYRGFLWRRVCRLHPLYVLTTLVCLTEAWIFREGLFAPGQTDSIPGAVLSNLLMTDTHLWEVDSINGPAWVVGVEVTLNLFFPLFTLLCLRSSARLGGLLAGLAFLMLVAVSVLDHRLNGGTAGALGTLDTRLMYARCGPELALGMYCWRFRDRFAWAGNNRWLSLILLGMLAMTPFKSLDLVFVPACCLLVMGLSVERGVVAGWFGTAVPHWLGTISYSIYLWHAAFLPLRPGLIALSGVADARTAAMLVNSAGLLLLLGFATLSYRWFEEPARRWLRALGASPARDHPG